MPAVPSGQCIGPAFRAGARTTKGFEVDLNFKVTSGPEAIVGYSKQKALRTEHLKSIQWQEN
jgi:hypothetical protein